MCHDLRYPNDLDDQRQKIFAYLVGGNPWRFRQTSRDVIFSGTIINPLHVSKYDPNHNGRHINALHLYERGQYSLSAIAFSVMEPHYCHDRYERDFPDLPVYSYLRTIGLCVSDSSHLFHAGTKVKGFLSYTGHFRPVYVSGYSDIVVPTYNGVRSRACAVMAANADSYSLMKIGAPPPFEAESGPPFDFDVGLLPTTELPNYLALASGRGFCFQRYAGKPCVAEMDEALVWRVTTFDGEFYCVPYNNTIVEPVVQIGRHFDDVDVLASVFSEESFSVDGVFVFDPHDLSDHPGAMVPINLIIKIADNDGFGKVDIEGLSFCVGDPLGGLDLSFGVRPSLLAGALVDCDPKMVSLGYCLDYAGRVYGEATDYTSAMEVITSVDAVRFLVAALDAVRIDDGIVFNSFDWGAVRNRSRGWWRVCGDRKERK
jgi:hypothetical protein